MGEPGPTVVSLFLAARSSIRVTFDDPVPDEVRSYVLADEYETLPGFCVQEFDLHFNAEPPDLEAVIQQATATALSSGACVAWCAFEGTFSFDRLLDAVYASSVYAVGVEGRVLVAGDGPTCSSEDRVHIVEAARRAVRYEAFQLGRPGRGIIRRWSCRLGVGPSGHSTGDRFAATALSCSFWS